MFQALKTAAVLVPLIGGFSGGAAVAGAGFWAWNNWVDNPGIVRTQEAVCVARVEKAASDARRIEQQRQLDAGRASAEAFIKTQLEAERQRQQIVEGLENEIASYETRLREQGRSCAVTADDLRYFGL